MPLGDDLTKAGSCVGRDGRLWLCGLAELVPYVERSDDGGRTKLAFADASERRTVVESCDDEAPTIAELLDGELVVCVTAGDLVRTYCDRRTAGERWWLL